MKKYFIFFLLINSYLLSDYNISYMMKYSDGKNIGTDIFENYIDMNMYYDNLYVYSFLKYANPPLIGYTTNSFDDFLKVLFVEYSNDNLDLTMGDILTVYGRGLSLHTYQDRDIDYNNGIRGVSFVYSLSDNWDIYSLTGKNTFQNRSDPANDPDINIDNELLSIGSTIYRDFYDLNYSIHINNQKIDASSIAVVSNFQNYLGDYLLNTLNILNNPLDDYSMKNYEHNIGGNFYFDDLEISSEYSKVFYNKIHGERTEGYRAYLSAYINIFGLDLLYEYKNYNTPYLYSVFSNPPTVFKETSSPLISRHLHAVDFNNEIGHQFVVNKVFHNQMNLAINYAFAYKHNLNNNIKEKNVVDVFENMLLFKDLNDFSNFLPYRQLNIEFNGWNEEENLFYKFGIDLYNEHINGSVDFMLGTKILEGITLPTQFSHMFDSGNSLSYYLEFQKLEDKAIPMEVNSLYFNPSFNYQGKWIFSLFYDYEEEEVSELIKKNWLGADFTYYISDTNIVSIFAGSQKGGLVCANGTCILQPDFENGFKVNLRTMF